MPSSMTKSNEGHNIRSPRSANGSSASFPAYARKITYSLAFLALLLASWSTSMRVVNNNKLVSELRSSRVMIEHEELSAPAVKVQRNMIKTISALKNKTSKNNNTTPHLLKRYYEVADLVNEKAKSFPHDYTTVYSRATVVEQPGNANPWFVKKKECKETCCFETVAISLDQDEHNIVNTLDGHELADVVLQHFASSDHLEFFAPSLTPELLPCLQPGTIISFENHGSLLEYFFQKLRPHIQVPIVVITSESDGDSPDVHSRRFAEIIKNDELILKWYGTNPHYTTVNELDFREKFEPMPLGLAKFHRQHPFLYSYLELNNFTNPFQDFQTRWKSKLAELEKATDNINDFMMVKFNVHEYAKHRGNLHNTLCFVENSTEYADTGISCSLDRRPSHAIYNASSRYLFGISPPGAGWDCYRTYEFLLTGVIPVIEERPGSRELFADLPVVHVPNLVSNTQRTRSDFVQILQNFIRATQVQEQQQGSSVFTNNKGWERLFLKYWRHRVLGHAGRDKEILTDPNTGRQYYQAYRYTKKPERVYCGQEGHCKTS